MGKLIPKEVACEMSKAHTALHVLAAVPPAATKEGICPLCFCVMLLRKWKDFPKSWMSCGYPPGDRMQGEFTVSHRNVAICPQHSHFLLKEATSLHFPIWPSRTKAIDVIFPKQSLGPWQYSHDFFMDFTVPSPSHINKSYYTQPCLLHLHQRILLGSIHSTCWALGLLVIVFPEVRGRHYPCMLTPLSMHTIQGLYPMTRYLITQGTMDAKQWDCWNPCGVGVYRTNTVDVFGFILLLLPISRKEAEVCTEVHSFLYHGSWLSSHLPALQSLQASQGIHPVLAPPGKEGKWRMNK